MKYKFFLSIILIIFLFICCQNVFAVERPLEVDYPEIAGEKPTTVQETLLPEYIKYLFNFSLIIVGLIAFAALVIGGFLYLISAGNPAALSDAKDRIFGALIGLVLLLCSWLILNTINPQLTIFYPIDLEDISFYQGTSGTVTLFDELNCNIDVGIITEEDCKNAGKEWLDIDKDDNKECIGGQMLNLSLSENLKRHQYNESDDWNDIAISLIFYGDDKRVRVCADSDLKECKILTTPKQCIDISVLRNDITGVFLGEDGLGALSSIEISDIPQGARLYEEKNFGGIYQEFPAGINGYDCKSGSELSRIGENRASSLEVGPGYWTVLCREPNGDCGWKGSGIVYDNFPENTGYGDTFISNNPADGALVANNDVGDNAVSKICVIKFGVCGGVLIKGAGKTDFIPRGEIYQLGKDSIVPSNSVTEVYQYKGGCKIKIWENGGTGAQCREPDAAGKCDCGSLNVSAGKYDNPDNAYGIDCETDDSCCGREWLSPHPDSWDTPGPSNALLDLPATSGACDFAGGAGFDCDIPPDGFNDCLTQRSNCTKYKYTFSELSCDYYATGNCCPGTPLATTFAKPCPTCNPINSISQKASCIQVIE